jgi:hypothetical protein
MTDEQNPVPPIEPSPSTPPVAPPVAPPAPPTAPPTAPPAAPTQQPYQQPYQQQPYGQQPGYAQAPYVQPGAYPGYAAPPPRGLSITSMVLGIVGLVGSFIYGFGLFPVIAAVITGFIARKRQPQGKAFWLTGLITGWVGIAICILWIVGLILLFTVFINNPDFRNSFQQGFERGTGGN